MVWMVVLVSANFWWYIILCFGTKLLSRL